jgi:small subunit ribosomal protein S1
MRRVRDLTPFIGQKIKAKILELDKNRNNVVLSRRQYLEETQSEVRETFLSQLKKGQIREGVVSSIVNFGAFVDLGGVDGLIHVSELSWKHIDHPSEVVKVGDKVTVEVLDVDMDRERISLSLKATQEDPWQRFARTHVPGQIVKGKVTKIVQFGVFISVEDGIEGLVHISELANRHVENPETVVKRNEEVFVKVIDVDLDRRRISLSLKQANDRSTDFRGFDPASTACRPSTTRGQLQVSGRFRSRDQRMDRRIREAARRVGSPVCGCSRPLGRAQGLRRQGERERGRFSCRGWPGPERASRTLCRCRHWFVGSFELLL